MDDDLETLTREELISEVKRLRTGIRAHRDSSGHNLCWHHPQLWGLLLERVTPEVAVPPWPKFLRGCVRYAKHLSASFRTLVWRMWNTMIRTTASYNRQLQPTVIRRCGDVSP